ncbi:kinase-like protein [Rhizoclosmatium globosum]|uniref:Kinase-like protein n=1 Tax=Rhizoclosmatium globosum TaxID=329046 RepID=A0A1Y2BQG8_9FUNG|nr:kinase-like protein [Rhizoclosmatium globosum]|eukprot:ORY36991.1 kinase-like protein [Rhizoclosmatium globosum]
MQLVIEAQQTEDVKLKASIETMKSIIQDKDTTNLNLELLAQQTQQKNSEQCEDFQSVINSHNALINDQSTTITQLHQTIRGQQVEAVALNESLEGMAETIKVKDTAIKELEVLVHQYLQQISCLESRVILFHTDTNDAIVVPEENASEHNFDEVTQSDETTLFQSESTSTLKNDYEKLLEQVEELQDDLEDKIQANCELGNELKTVKLELKGVTEKYLTELSRLPLEWEQEASDLGYIPLTPRVSSIEASLWDVDFLLNGSAKLDEYFTRIVGLPLLGLELKGPSQSGKRSRLAEVCIKTVRINRNTWRSVNRVASELRVLAYSDHPNVLAAMEFFKRQNRVEMVLPYFEMSLHGLLAVAPVIHADVAGVLIFDLIGGLEYLHDVMGVCHRDIKPSNLLLSVQKAMLVIADFDLSAPCNSPTVGLTDGVGTDGYIAPEVYDTISGLSASYGTACDLFSAGVVTRAIIARVNHLHHGPSDDVLVRTLGFVAGMCMLVDPTARATAQQIQQSNMLAYYLLNGSAKLDEFFTRIVGAAAIGAGAQGTITMRKA